MFPGFDEQTMKRKLDVVKSKIFLNGTQTAFFSSLMCSLEFKWDMSVDTAGTDGVSIFWNPEFFLKTPEKTNISILYHELNHAARMHYIRCGSRNTEIWNYACDIRINNDLDRDGFTFDGLPFKIWLDHSYDRTVKLSEEDIYDLLVKNSTKIPAGGFGPNGKGDMLPGKADPATVIANVVRAVQQAQIAGQAGSIPGDIEDMLCKFLKPIVPWESVLHDFLTELMDTKYSWKRPNRRHQDIYLPARIDDDGRLEHLIYFLDVSGSVSDQDILRFNSEVKYIQEDLRPKRLTLVQFDTKIRDVKEFEVDQPFDEIEVIGRGGTSLEEVCEYINEHKPTAAVIFTDLDCAPMQKPKDDIPVIWAINNHRNKPSFGKYIVVEEK